MVKVRIPITEAQKKSDSENDHKEDNAVAEDSVDSKNEQTEQTDNNDDEQKEVEDKNDKDYNDKGENGEHDGSDDEYLNAVSKSKESPRKRKRIHKHTEPESPSKPKRKVVHGKKDAPSSPKTPKKSGGHISFRDASLQMLQNNGGPLSAVELAKRAIDEGLVVTQGKTPDRTIAAMIYNEIRHRADSPFVLHSPGVFSLKEFGGEPAPKKRATPKKKEATSTPKRSTPRRRTKSSKDDEDEEMDDGTKEDANDTDYSDKKAKSTPRKSTPKKSTPKKRTAAVKGNDEEKIKKKRRISHKDDETNSTNSGSVSAKESEDDIDDDLLSIMKNKDQSSGDDSSNNKEKSSKPPSRKQMIFDKVKNDKDTNKDDAKEEPEKVKDEVEPTQPQEESESPSPSTSSSSKPTEKKQLFKHSTTDYLPYMSYYSELAKEKDESTNQTETTEEQECFVCKGKGNSHLLCDFAKCPKVYHLACVNLTSVPDGDWICPRHYCIECVEKENKNLDKPNSHTECSTCPTSYCEKHLPAGQLESMIDGSQIICGECKPLYEKMDAEEEDSNKSQDKDANKGKDENVEVAAEEKSEEKN
ncbi:histone-lysine N-methyltransferase [Acrasis kona]|uniref:Histone-lysine N-methyltransferase n=1 Tax=Acrasis kona TaxID=1008807 RepID=A0AAW2Z8J6_9EUKA